LSRAHRSRDPLDRLRREIARLIDEPAAVIPTAATTRQSRKSGPKEHR